MKGIILAGGKADSSLCQLFGDIPTGMAPVSGKPVLFYILENFIKNGIRDIWVAVGYNRGAVDRLITDDLRAKADIRLVEVDPARKPGDSLLTAARAAGEGKALIACADSYLRLAKEDLEADDVVFTAQKMLESRLWCTVRKDTQGFVERFHDKEESGTDEALVGVYLLADLRVLHEGVPVEGAAHEISDLLKGYQKSRRLRCVVREDWLDFGHLGMYQSSRKKMLVSRHFNRLDCDDFLGTITKRSANKRKLADEIRWTLALPDKLKILAPRVLEHDVAGPEPWVTMEYYGYETLAEIWLYSDFRSNVLRSILGRVWDVLKLFHAEKREVSRRSYELMYLGKTDERVEALRREDPVFAELLGRERLVVNGKECAGWDRLRPQVARRVAGLYDSAHNCLIHGDFCFSNILYDVNGGIVRLLDARGRWGEGADGDIKYDVAKLRHSVHGGYDFMIADLFHVRRAGERIDYALQTQGKHAEVAAWFDARVAESFRLADIRLIEGLLFLSMIPYHKDDAQRQLVMFGRAMELLNEEAGPR